MPLVLVTGAFGFIGRYLSKQLALEGCKVVGLGHGLWSDLESAHFGLKCWINGDIVTSNLRLLQKSFGAPEVVYHLAGGSSVGAAVANPKEDFFRTVNSTVEILEWIRQESPTTKMVAVSSAAVYGAGHEGPISTNSALNPYSPYGFHKLMMEDLCRSYASSYGLCIAVARLFSVYGAGLKKQLLWDICSKIHAGDQLIKLGGNGGELRDWVHISDVVNILSLVSNQPSKNVPVFNVGSGDAVSVRSIAQEIIDIWNSLYGRSCNISFSGQSRVGDPYSLVANRSSIDSLGYKNQINLEKGLADYVEWYVANAVVY